MDIDTWYWIYTCWNVGFAVAILALWYWLKLKFDELKKEY